MMGSRDVSLRAVLKMWMQVSAGYPPLSPPPQAVSQQPTLPFPGKFPAVTCVHTFKTACKMTSRGHIIAGPVSAKKTIVYYLQFTSSLNK